MSVAVATVEVGGFTALAAGPADAPLALVLHGFSDAPPTFAPLLGALADRGYRVVAPWLRGYAPSPLAGPYDVDRLADDVLAWADRLSPTQPVALVGHDWGAAVTYVACARAPARFAAAVTLAVPHPAVFVRSLARRRQLARSWYMLAFQVPGVERLAAARDFALIDRLWADWSPGFTLPAELRAALHATLRTSWPAPLLYYRALTRPPGAALARLRRRDRIAVPTLYLHGARDGCIGPEVGVGAERFFTAGYRREVVPDVGHFVAAEAPMAIAARIAAWLDAHAR
ncbi:MAG: alpha/beta fold hydrolase [Kofleriaceae bacterium]|nr:alpha/beta fold hydrolase [Kofleriaceae bacterium]MBP9167922.1 alpha/beta fold hydrolase [Kofleriaceae bacterium]MBP9856756.1 alpha/beta fold hydrolase [Kofleriaceae bacterium]